MKKFGVGIVCFSVAAVIAFFGVQFFLKTGIFKVPGKVVVEDGFPREIAEKITLETGEKPLEKDVFLSKFFGSSLRASLNEITEAEGEFSIIFLKDVFVTTADFYETRNSVSEAELQAMLESGSGDVISISKLDEARKLLAVDGVYYLDSFEAGAKFEYLKVSGKNEEDVKRMAEAIKPELADFPTKEAVLTFAQTGVTALSRRMNTKLWSVGSGAYFAENIGDYLSGFDITHTSNESSFSDYATGANICSDWGFVETLTRIGLDVVELTGNHNVDCGDVAATATIEKYAELGIKPVGGGRSASEAAEPLKIDEKGTKIVFLAYNQSTGGATYDETPGANQYYEEDARNRIHEAKEEGAFVIVDMQYYECNEYDYTWENTYCDHANSSAGDQIGLFRSLIDMGADVVVGTSAHQTQTFERYGDGEIYYGLGNLFFDQSWWPGTTRSLGLVHYFWNGNLLQTKRFGTVYDDSYQTRLMSEEEETWFINRLNEARP